MGESKTYKIAVASTDGIHIDRNFKDAEKFFIYQVEAKDYEVKEVRKWELSADLTQEGQSVCQPAAGCGDGKGCGNGTGCGGEDSPKVLLIGDCRCIVCTKTGFGIQKKLERKAISAFEIDCEIKEALDKIVEYFFKIDNHQSLRGIAKQK